MELVLYGGINVYTVEDRKTTGELREESDGVTVTCIGCCVFILLFHVAI